MARGRNRLVTEDAEFVMARVKSLTAAMPTMQMNSQISWKANSSTCVVEGVTQDFPVLRSLYPVAGRFLLESDVEMRRKVCVVGQTVVEEVFDGENPIGEVLTVQGQPMTVVGVMEKRGASMGIDNDNVVFTPLSTLQRLAGTRYVSFIFAQVKTADDVDRAMSAISQAFNSKFRDSDTVNVTSQQQLIDVISTITGTFTILLASIAGISLLVGGIGIMNIMFVSVTERTREIGLRKAVGGKNRDILIQFLIESVILSGFGGLIGIVLGIYLSGFVAKLGGWPQYVSPSAIGLALGFSVAVGVFFGLYPAMRAAKMNPISALRYE
jgi:putative ABC transport system permease protein